MTNQRNRALCVSEGSVARSNRALCAAWLDWLGKHGRTAMTCYQYAQKLDHLCEYAAARPLGSLTVSELEQFTTRSDHADATIQKDVVVLRGLYSWALSHGHVNANPAIDLRGPTVKNHMPRAIDDELWSKVWRAELDDPMRMALGLGYYCGLRRAEICELQVHHFDADRIVHFPRKGDRNDKNTGVIPYVSCARLYSEKRPDLLAMPEDLLLPLDRLRHAAGGSGARYLLPWGRDGRRSPRSRPEAVGPPAGMTSPDVVNRRLQLLLRRLGLPDRAFTPHALRHSFATNMLSMGVPLANVSQLCNHGNVNITMRYLKLAEDPLAQFLDVPLAGRNRWLAEG